MLHALLFLTVYCIGFILAFVSNPVFSFVVYETVYFFNPGNRWWNHLVPTFSYSFFAVVWMLIVWLKVYKESKVNKILVHSQFKWLFAVLSLYAIASYYAVFPDLHANALTYYAKLVVILLIAYKLCDTDIKLNYALYGYMFGAWYIGILAYQTGRNRGGRVEGIGMVDSPDSNVTAAAIAPSLVFFLYYFWISKNNYVRAAIVFGGVFVANGLILIGSRGAFLGALSGVTYFLLYMFFSGFQRKHQKLITILIIVVGLSGALSLMDDTFIERMYSMKQADIENTEQETGSTRIYFWLAAWEMAKDYPYGQGFHGFNFYAPLYIRADVNTGSSLNRSVHSTWFEVLSEIGYLGLFCFVMMIYSAFRALKLCKRKLKSCNDVDNYFKIIAIEGALLVFIVTMSFINRMRAEILYWLILYSICAYNIYVIKYSDKSKL